MTTNQRISCFALMLAVSAVNAEALYRIKTPDGRIIISDSPIAGRPDNERRLIDPNQNMSVGRASASSTATGGSSSALSTSRGAITLYTLPGCPACSQAKSWLAQNSVPYTEKGAENPSILSEAKAKGAVGVPFIVTPKGNMAGFNAEKYTRLVK